jgi:hypothetical protein
MPVSSVAAGQVITPAWGNAVADGLNAFDPVAWSVTSVGQPGPVTCTTHYGWRCMAAGGLFHAQIQIEFTAAGVTGNNIQVSAPYTLIHATAIGGTFIYGDIGSTYHTGAVMPI